MARIVKKKNTDKLSKMWPVLSGTVLPLITHILIRTVRQTSCSDLTTRVKLASSLKEARRVPGANSRTPVWTDQVTRLSPCQSTSTSTHPSLTGCQTLSLANGFNSTPHFQIYIMNIILLFLSAYIRLLLALAVTKIKEVNSLSYLSA